MIDIAVTAPFSSHIATISSLDVDTLAPGTHQFWFAAISDSLNQPYQIPVWVFKGKKAGKKIMITAGVHGDEYNGMLSAQKLAQQLHNQEISGCITLIPCLNIPGARAHNRFFISACPDLQRVDLNRVFPGNAEGNEAQRYIAAIWQQVLKNNADLAIDLHTQTTGTVYPLYIFADFRIKDALQMARLTSPDAILNDPGEAGVLETVWNQHNIPSMTVEIGAGRYQDHALITRAVEGVLNVLRFYQCVTDSNPVAYQPAIESDNVTSIKATQGGFVVPCVSLLEHVKENQLLARQYDLFGQEIAAYYAPKAGVVLSHNLDAMRAAGSLVVRLIHP